MKSFPSDNSKLAEMEFYLVDDLECDLTVFHPYRTLMSLCRKENDTSGTGDMPEAEAGELGFGIGSEDGPKYWGTGEGQLELQAGALQMAWYSLYLPIGWAVG
jgi:cyclin C